MTHRQTWLNVLRAKVLLHEKHKCCSEKFQGRSCETSLYSFEITDTPLQHHSYQYFHSAALYFKGIPGIIMLNGTVDFHAM